MAEAVKNVGHAPVHRPVLLSASALFDIISTDVWTFVDVLRLYGGVI